MKCPLHVAVGVIQDSNGRILIARRPQHLHQGGLWEFPGGKVNAGEDVIIALQRELHEELGIDVTQTRPLMTIEHDYGDKRVFLDVHSVTVFSGKASGREGQAVQWVSIDKLNEFDFPAANRGIVNALRLPDRYMITGEFSDNADCVAKIRRAMQQGVRLVQLRAKHLAEPDYLALAERVMALQAENVVVLLNTTAEIFERTDAMGLHLSSQGLMQLQRRPIAANKLLSVAVHNDRELARAKQVGADLLLISPVMSTASHPHVPAMGWAGFTKLVAMANVPAYALGGMTLADISIAQEHGGQGIAAIGALWPESY
jgi:8-oxo-dGTP diphosphatase